MKHLALTLLAAVILFQAPPGLAQDMTCADNGFTCARKKLDFGTSQITCYDREHAILSVWECEFEAETTCTNVSTREQKITGFLPVDDRMCPALCGKCETGWK